MADLETTFMVLPPSMTNLLASSLTTSNEGVEDISSLPLIIVNSSRQDRPHNVDIVIINLKSISHLQNSLMGPLFDPHSLVGR